MTSNNRPLVCKIDWWRVWRRPMCGLNPFRWELPGWKHIKPGGEVYFDGYKTPGDGLGGSFKLCVSRDIEVPDT